MKRYRGEQPSYTKWIGAWRPYRPMHKAGARQKRIEQRIADANTRIAQQTGIAAHINWGRDELTGKAKRAPSPETAAAMAELITAAARYFTDAADYTAREIRPGVWQHTWTYPEPVSFTMEQE